MTSPGVIQELLRENGAAGLNGGAVRITAAGVEAPPSEDVQSPETYAGYGRAERFVSRERLPHDSQRSCSLSLAPALNQWGLAGLWNGSPAGFKVTVDGAGNGRLGEVCSREWHLATGSSKFRKGDWK